MSFRSPTLSLQDRERAAELLVQLADAATDADREKILNGLAHENDAVRREVESLVTSLEGAGTRFDHPAWQHAEGQRDLKLSLGAMSRIGPYVLLREIGRGGMGAVYEAARADQAYEGRVAIKTVGRALPSESLIRRFRQERQILAGLQHPNIATLYDGGTTSDGIAYLVMEYVEGVPIDVYCATKRLTTRQRLVLALQMCAALQHGHSRLIVHRDLTPGNMLVTADGVVKLLDFGPHSARNTDRPATVRLTQQVIRGGRAHDPRHPTGAAQSRGRPGDGGGDPRSLVRCAASLLAG